MPNHHSSVEIYVCTGLSPFERAILLVFNFSLAKLHHGGPSSLKVVKKLLDAGEISSDIISIADEMYNQQQNKWYP